MGALPSSYPQERWPPSPFVFGVFVLPILRALYRRGFTRLSKAILGLPSSTGGVAAPARPMGDAAGGDAVIQINLAAEPEDNNAAAAAAPAAEPPLAGRQININADSLGQTIGGALLIPAISSFMGSMVLRLSRRSALLRAFLGIRSGLGRGRVLAAPPVFGPAGGYATKGWAGLGLFTGMLGPGFLERMSVTARIVLGNIWGGSVAWAEADPVWWRNALGLGLFIVAKDCLHLWHLWLEQRELKSRRVLNKDFKGVDIRELDLDPSFYQQT